MDKLSYALGMSLGQSLQASDVNQLEFDDFLSGVKVIFSGEEPQISAEYGNQILQEFFDKKKKEKEEAEKVSRQKNLTAGQEFLKKNAEESGVIVTASGLQYKVIKDGDGNPPDKHGRVRVHYEGRLLDGQVFDSSYKRGTPTEFGLDQVIPGWAEGLQLMKVGSKYEFYIPAHLAYGEVGVPGIIPGNSVLIFIVELLDVL